MTPGNGNRPHRATRRGVLAAGVAGATGIAGAVATGAATLGGGALLAGCGGGNCQEWSEEHRPASRPAGPAPPGGGTVLAALAEIPVGRGVTALGPDGEPVVVVRTAETVAVAFSARCTHHGCLVNPDGDRLRCPPHDGWFDAGTGTPSGGPPKKPLRRIQVAVIDGNVVTTA